MQVVLGKIERDIQRMMVDSLDQRIGGDVIKPLYSFFGEDLFLILSILNGSHHHFPSIKSLNALIDQCNVHKKVQIKLDNGMELDRAIQEVSYDISLPPKRVLQLYERKLESSDGD